MTTSSDMSTDMTAPVTRAELREELGQLERRSDGKLEGLEHRIDGKLEGLEQRFDGKLELWGGALLARIDEVSARVDTMGISLVARIEAGEQRMFAELARHFGAIQETFSRQISAVDEKYADLPARVSKLEADAARRRPRGR